MAFALDDTLSRIIELDLRSPRIVPFLAGEPAIGKTSFIKALGERVGFKVFAISINTMADKGDLTGARTLQDPQDQQWKQMFFPHETILEANLYAAEHPDETVILLLDEINRADSDVTSATMTLSTERRAGTTDLEPNIRIVTTGNLTGNVTTLDSASLTRFALYEVVPSTDKFLELMGDKLNPWIKAVLHRYPEYIFIKPQQATLTATAEDINDPDDDDAMAAMANFQAVFDGGQDMVQYTAPRTLEGLSQWLNAADRNFLYELLSTSDSTSTHSGTGSGQGNNRTMLQACLEAHTGDTAFTSELIGVIANDLVTPTTVATATVTPDRPDAWGDLLSMRTRTEMERHILDNLDTEERVEMLFYALHNSHDYQVPEIVEILISPGVIDRLNGEQSRTLFRFGEVPQRNLAVLSGASTPLTQTLAPLLPILGAGV